MKKFLFFSLILFSSLVSAGQFEFFLNPVSANSYLAESTSFIFSKAGTDTSIEYFMDLQTSQVVPISNDLLKKSDSFLYSASITEAVNFSLMELNDKCVVLLFYGKDSFQKVPFPSVSVQTLYLHAGDKVFLANAIKSAGECNYKLQFKDKTYSFTAVYQLFPYLEDYIPSKLTKTENCQQYFKDEALGLEACYSDYKNLVDAAGNFLGSCSDQEFLALDKEGCKTRLLSEYQAQKKIDEIEKEELRKISAPVQAEETKKTNDAIHALVLLFKNAGISADNENEKNSLMTLLGVICVLVAVLYNAKRTRDKQNYSEHAHVALQKKPVVDEPLKEDSKKELNKLLQEFTETSSTELEAVVDVSTKNNSIYDSEEGS